MALYGGEIREFHARSWLFFFRERKERLFNGMRVSLYEGDFEISYGLLRLRREALFSNVHTPIL